MNNKYKFLVMFLSLLISGSVIGAGAAEEIIYKTKSGPVKINPKGYDDLVVKMENGGWYSRIDGTIRQEPKGPIKGTLIVKDGRVIQNTFGIPPIGSVLTGTNQDFLDALVTFKIQEILVGEAACTASEERRARFAEATVGESTSSGISHDPSTGTIKVSGVTISAGSVVSESGGSAGILFGSVEKHPEAKK